VQHEANGHGYWHQAEKIEEMQVPLESRAEGEHWAMMEEVFHHD
jgi:L-rhamnose mutarotase